MRKIRKLPALLLALAMVFSAVGCADSGETLESEEEPIAEASVAEEPVEEELPAEDPFEEEPVAEEPAEEVPDTADTLVFGEDAMEGNFNPLFYTAATDGDVNGFIFDSLLVTDREGAVITRGIEGEVVAYNGTDYTYYAPADCAITQNEDGSVDYVISLRDDIRYSDGSCATIDDVLFALYVVLDPTYDGICTVNSLPIAGLDAYRSGMRSLLDLLLEAGEDNTDFSLWDEATQTAFWADVRQAGTAFAQEIVDYCAAAGYAVDSDDVYNGAGARGFDVPEDATAEDFFLVMCDAYDRDLVALSDAESVGSSLFDLMDDYDVYSVGVETGASADSVSGIVKNDAYSMTITMTSPDATAVYALQSVPLLSAAYYGDGPVDAENNYFGFQKGDLTGVKSHTGEPLGSGPYSFIDFTDGTVRLQANPYYWKGEPNISYVDIVTVQDADKISALESGTIDIAAPTYGEDTVDQICAVNGNGSVVGDVITTCTVDNPGYGYIGINADNVCVGGDGGSYESRCLRKGLATVFAVYRDQAVSAYYGELAEIINYPISDTSWAAPGPADEDYAVAFSVDVNGDPIYTDDMTDEEKYAAALDAALGYFQAAGYTVEDGILVAAPEGAKLEYGAMVPGGGIGDHPGFLILTSARDALATIGMTLVIDDLSDGTVTIGNRLAAGAAEIWALAWGVGADPDMVSIYYADVANGGANAGEFSMCYDIRDADLDELILLARQSTDLSYRKTLYRQALDIVVDWACEVPVYQRLSAYVLSTERINPDTLTPDITTYWSPFRDIESLEMN